MPEFSRSNVTICPAVADALAAGKPVVALESSVIGQGLPYPDNYETALAMEAILRERDVAPATLGIVDGRIIVGMSEGEIARFSQDRSVAKAAARDMAPLLVRGASGALTVSASLVVAETLGIPILATGGIGGVHRGAAENRDVSADLFELSRRHVVVVCAGAKAILDLPATLEELESLSVPVIGYRTRTFPAFFCSESGLALSNSVDDVKDVARFAHMHWSLPSLGGLVLAVAPPAEKALSQGLVESGILTAEEEAKTADIKGAALTPFLLSRLDAITGGKTREANKALLRRNAEVAAELATSLTQE